MVDTEVLIRWMDGAGQRETGRVGVYTEVSQMARSELNPTSGRYKFCELKQDTQYLRASDSPT